MAFDLSILKPNPAPAPAVSPVPGMVFLKTIQVTQPNYNQATALANITIDAPSDATFAKYRAIVFRFYGIGFANATAANINITPRRTSQNIGGAIYYQTNQMTGTATNAWVNTSATATIPITNGTPAAQNFPLNSLNITMHPVGFDIDYSFGSNTTLPIGSIGKATGTYTVPAATSLATALNEYPGFTLSLTTANYFVAWNYAAGYVELGITCDIYGILKS